MAIDFKLSGRVRFRVSRFTSKLIIQVHESPPNADHARWRDATYDDMSELASEVAIEFGKLKLVGR